MLFVSVSVENLKVNMLPSLSVINMTVILSDPCSNNGTFHTEDIQLGMKCISCKVEILK